MTYYNLLSFLALDTPFSTVRKVFFFFNYKKRKKKETTVLDDRTTTVLRPYKKLVTK